MSDPTLARKLAGHTFLRADTLRQERADDPTRGIERMLRGMSGWLPPRTLHRQRIDAFAARIGALAQGLRDMDQAAVQQRFRQAQTRLKARPQDEAELAEVFACVGEGSRRALGMWPHPVQFAGARVLLTGCLAEMQTGEGKTLVAALAATVMAGSGAHVHVVSTNDYLAQRDCEEMSPLFGFFDLASAHVVGEMDADERQQAYRHIICYASGKEIVFDYLKDRLAGHGLLPTRTSYLQRFFSSDGGAAASRATIPALHFAIVDEADSVLIDEARTPMILSRESPGIHEATLLTWAIDEARRLQEGTDFKLDPANHDVQLQAHVVPGLGPLPEGIRGGWQSPAWREMLLKQALTALHHYQLDQHYIIAEDKVQIVDESTGRVMADRSWEQGLHQLIEIKEGLDTTAGRETLARMTFQRFFRRYYLLSGLTGTAAEAHRELWSVYQLPVRRIPPHRPNQRLRLLDQCCASLADKWVRVADDAMQAAAKGQPVLIGTRSVEASEKVSQELHRRGVAHTVLNARQDAEEADIVRAAGQGGRITVATNMAGRGTDIKLKDEARLAGGLHVILTEFHESARVDRQLFGRSGRQGDPGTTRAIVSVEDTLLAHEKGLAMYGLRQGTGETLTARLLAACVWMAQRKAQRRAYQSRMATLKQDQTLSQMIGFAGKTI